MFEFTLERTQGSARAGRLTLPHGQVETPAFMPVGTHGVVRGLSAADMRRTGAQIILGNTYHLHLRPGEEIVREMGGLNRFTTWDRPMLTDSGGFQVFSLSGLRRISEQGVEFQSHVDGTLRTITPERAVEIQWALGADIAMAFDHVVPGQAPTALALEGMERTLRWLDRCRVRFAQLADEAAAAGEPPPQTLWPIVQGGTHDDLRLASLEGILARGPWTGIAIGGLSVGEPKPVMHRLLELLGPGLPSNV
ncbi:MAG TPA: tRNA guanosine(34) transglycosylase Tgt, partial [Gemmatimonadales bacterium]|nr:tRNA guanosine(34) transglycosylase Tgt [Gemmatimonadales bacterium]